MRALIIGHDHASPSGLIGERLVDRGFELDTITVVPAERYRAPGVDFDFPALRGYDLVVPLGAPWSVDDHATIGSWVGGELALLREAHALGVPVLGICFGAQALATALGGAVERAPRPEIGWMSVETDAPELVPEGPWFQTHFDRFVVPPGAEELARSAVGPQAFRTGRSLGVQFHPELTEATLRGWLDLGLYDQARGLGIDPDELLERTRELRAEARRRAHVLVDGFLDRVARSPAATGAVPTASNPG
ncbi:type 1 glutamine amidotransferase [Streptomyces sp. NPDC058686]|uniref:type 1 glutamine amidotransferase n=1 Tax=Streptomyces sp. NPDC058686 TaxID=3346599 RepID=UPI003662C17E